jgi:ubiquinone/menaquinone biosynthesis C-methylase UbiE
MRAVDDGPWFARDLYRGTADDYERFRLGYPGLVTDDLLGRIEPSGAGRLLDLACGTGQLAFALGGPFVEVWAVDQEADMIRVVEAKATTADRGHVRPVLSSAEDLDAPAGWFELVTIGNAFHRLRRDHVAAKACEWLTPGGHLAICWSDVPWLGPLDWQQALFETLERWKAHLGAGDRVPPAWETPRQQRSDLEVLADAGFSIVGRRSLLVEHRWTLEDLVGFVYATSFLPRSVVGASASDFEADVAKRVGRYAQDGTLFQTVSFAYELGQRPCQR